MKKLIISVMALLVLVSCEDLTELNKDVKNPQEVPAGSLFANATVELFDYMSSPNVNENNFRLWAQQWAQTTYADESNYELVERNVNGRFWNRLYATVITDARAARADIATEVTTLTAAQITSQQASMEVLEIFAMHILVDIFGDMPYTEAFDAGVTVTPKYDDDATIYADLATRLDAAIANLGSGNNGMGVYDLVYGGNADAWKMMANSLKLRMAIRMADVNPAKAKEMAEAAAPGVFTSSADDFTLPYQGSTPNTNPLWEDLVQSGRSDFVAANTMVDMLKALNDPRIDEFYQDQFEVVIDTVTGATEMQFLGGVYGDNNNYNAHSHPGTRQFDPTHPGMLLTYTEVRFLLADAAARTWNVPGTPAAHYEAAVTNSIMEWGGTAAEATDYLAQPEVAYATAAGDWKTKIGTQKWIAMYDQGFEAWSSYRLYDAPTLNIAAQAGIPTPTRFTYPVTEYSLNEVSVAAAGEAMGGDNLSSKVFWDVN